MNKINNENFRKITEAREQIEESEQQIKEWSDNKKEWLGVMERLMKSSVPKFEIIDPFYFIAIQDCKSLGIHNGYYFVYSEITTNGMYIPRDSYGFSLQTICSKYQYGYSLDEMKLLEKMGIVKKVINDNKITE